jgi:hypothetical protein
MEYPTGLTPVTETGGRRSGKRLPRDNFKNHPTITLTRQTDIAFPCGREYYLALVDINNITQRPWMRSAFSTFCGSLSIDLKDLQKPFELLNSLKFRELSHVYISSKVLDKERSRFEEQFTNEWTGKWTGDELVQGINKMPLPEKKEEIRFLEIPRDAIVDHSQEYYICRRNRWVHLSGADRDMITEALKSFEDSCVKKWNTPTRQSRRLMVRKLEA